MRNARILPELIGKTFGLDPEGSGSISTINAVQVNDFCSQDFVARGNIAVIEYGKLSENDIVLHFKTLFKNCGVNTYVVSPPCPHTKMDKNQLRRSILSVSKPILEDWGINLLEIVELIFQNSHGLPVTAIA